MMLKVEKDHYYYYYDLPYSLCPFSIGGKSVIASLTVTARSGAPLSAGAAQYFTPPGRLMVSCGEWNTCKGCGQFGSFSLGAAAMMKVRLRDCGTP